MKQFGLEGDGTCAANHHKPVEEVVGGDGGFDIILLHPVKIQGMNQVGLSAPLAEYLEMMSLRSVKILRGVRPMGISACWEDYPNIIAFRPVKKLQGIDPNGLNSPWDEYIDMISLQPIRKK